MQLNLDMKLHGISHFICHTKPQNSAVELVEDVVQNTLFIYVQHKFDTYPEPCS